MHKMSINVYSRPLNIGHAVPTRYVLHYEGTQGGNAGGEGVWVKCEKVTGGLLQHHASADETVQLICTFLSHVLALRKPSTLF